jgi:hypothetical protein
LECSIQPIDEGQEQTHPAGPGAGGLGPEPQPDLRQLIAATSAAAIGGPLPPVLPVGQARPSLARRP